jgi:hypothetical protein
MSCEQIAKVLYLDDDTIRYWYRRSCELTAVQEDALKSWVAQTLPRAGRLLGAQGHKDRARRTSGRQRLNRHGAVDLTGATRMIELTTVDAASTIALLMAIVMIYYEKVYSRLSRGGRDYYH